jgi:hypothetical protein
MMKTFNKHTMKKLLFSVFLTILSVTMFAQGSGPKPADIVDGVTSRPDLRLKVDWAADEADYASSIAVSNLSLIRNPTGTYTLAGPVTVNLNSQSIIYQDLSIDDTETYLIAIDPTSGLLSRRAVSSISGGGGASAFTDLTDAPASYTGVAGSLVTVNSGNNGLVFSPVYETNTSVDYVFNVKTTGKTNSSGIEISGDGINDLWIGAQPDDWSQFQIFSDGSLMLYAASGIMLNSTPIDEAEAYVLAIDDASGLISRRSAAGLGGGGGGDLLSSNNLSDVANVATSRTNLGVYSTSETYSTSQTDALFNGVTLSTVAGATFFLNGSGDYTQITRLGAYAYSSTALSPTVSEDGYVITWNQSSGNYDLTAPTGGGVTAHGDLTGIGTKTHAVLEADILDIYDRINDTVTTASEKHFFVFGLGANNAADDAVMLVDANMGGWYHNTGDTLVAVELRINVEGASGDMTMQVFSGSDPYGTGAAVSAATQVTTSGGEVVVTSFTNDEILSGNWIWAELTVVGTAGDAIIGSFTYTLK